MHERLSVWGVCGGTGAGKTTFVDQLIDHLHIEVTVLSFDAYYHDLVHLTPEERAAMNFDHPDSLDVDLYSRHLDRLAAGEAVDVPLYDFANHARLDTTARLEPRPLVIAEGILLLAFPEICERLDFAVYLDVPAEVRFERRLSRDVVERGRDPEGVRRQWESTVAPMHDQFVEPHAGRADRVVALDEDRQAVLAELGELVGRDASRRHSVR